MVAKPSNLELDPKHMAIILAVALTLFLAFTSFTRIDTNEKGVLLRLGKYREPLLEPGAHFVIPLIDRVYTEETEVIHKVEFGYRSKELNRSSSRKGVVKESLMVSGDLNMAEVEWSVQYRISNPYNYMFKVRDQIDTLRDLSSSVMSQVLGDRTVYEALTVGRDLIELESTQLLQESIDYYDMGITILNLKLQNVLPPDKVKPSYNEVNEAEQYREQQLNEAQRERNSVVPKARGQAKQRVEQAKGYRIDRINRARGEAERFVAVYEAYSKAKDVTRKRMYLEAMSEVLQSLDQVILLEDSSALPLLNLDKGDKK